MKDFHDLKVWSKAHQLTLVVYRETKSFPAEERFGLSSQLRRCAASIPANIAEACGRSGDGDFQRFLQIATGSASELEYHLLLANDLGYFPNGTGEQLTVSAREIKKMLASLISKVRSDRDQTPGADR